MPERRSRRHARPTVLDVARVAGTSTSTAARALSGNGYVSAEVRARVWEAARQQGYVPNAVARSLRAAKTHTIGVLITDIGNPFYAEVADGVEQVLRSRGYQVLLADSDGGDPNVESAVAETFLSMRVDGLIVTPAVPSSGIVSRLTTSGTLVVEVDRTTSDPQCDAVLVDNQMGAFEATQHLVERGHRSIGLILGETKYASIADRLAGYRAALIDNGLEPDDSLVAHAGHDPSGARSATDALLREHPEVTAIFATNGLLALGALRALRENRREIPRDISLVAFDEAAWMAIVQPAITTVAQPTEAMGREAARVLVERLAGLAGPPVAQRLPTRFILRESTAAPRSRM